MTACVCSAYAALQTPQQQLLQLSVVSQAGVNSIITVAIVSEHSMLVILFALTTEIQADRFPADAVSRIT